VQTQRFRIVDSSTKKDQDITVTVTDSNQKIAQTIHWELSAEGGAVGEKLNVTVTGGESGEPVKVVSMTDNICLFGGNASAGWVELIAKGVCVLQATQAGNERYQAAPSVDVNITVEKALQTIQFTLPAKGTVGNILPLSATGGNSGNPVMFASTPLTVCTLSENTLKLIAAGTCTVTANQAGNDKYDAARKVSATIVSEIAFPICVGFEIDDKNLRISASSDPNEIATAVGGISVEGSNPQCDGAQVTRGQKILTKLKLRVAPQDVGKSGKTFLLIHSLYLDGGKYKTSLTDVGGNRYIDLKPGVIAKLGAWGGLGETGNFDQLPSEINLFDQTQIIGFSFPKASITLIGGYSLTGTSKARFVGISATIQ
jgi:hypothetical protein